MTLEPVLIAGEWRPAKHAGSLRAVNPATGEPLDHEFPISTWADCEAALAAAGAAAKAWSRVSPSTIGQFLEVYAARLDDHTERICTTASLETALPCRPRLAEVEMPRTIDQLRQAAAAARDGSWRMAVIDTTNNLRSCYGSIGPVVLFGPSNFPLAFNAISGGDFAAAIAAGNPVIAKAHPSHPRTSQLLAQAADEAARAVGAPPGTVQLLYEVSRQDGLRLVRDERIGAAAFTGSRASGLALKADADAVGKPIYLEMSSVNPVFFLPGVIRERREMLVNELANSCLLGSGQFCTCPNLFVVFRDDDAEAFLADLKAQFEARPSGPLLSAHVQQTLANSVAALQQAGAELVTGGRVGPPPGFRFETTLLRVSGEQFLREPSRLQTEAFGNATLAVVVGNLDQARAVAERLEGSLTASLYSTADASDEPNYSAIADVLRRRVGRLLNDKMPTGVVVSPAMNHGGPFPATGHPNFTAVGIPSSLRRFAMLECYDNVRPHRLPMWLQDASPNGRMWRLIDNVWTQGDVSA